MSWAQSQTPSWTAPSGCRPGSCWVGRPAQLCTCWPPADPEQSSAVCSCRRHAAREDRPGCPGRASVLQDGQGKVAAAAAAKPAALVVRAPTHPGCADARDRQRHDASGLRECLPGPQGAVCPGTPSWGHALANAEQAGAGPDRHHPRWPAVSRPGAVACHRAHGRAGAGAGAQPAAPLLPAPAQGRTEVLWPR